MSLTAAQGLDRIGKALALGLRRGCLLNQCIADCISVREGVREAVHRSRLFNIKGATEPCFPAGGTIGGGVGWQRSRHGNGGGYSRRCWRLEDRRLLSNIVVTNTASSGTGSLAWAVGQANLNGGAETITFDESVFKTAQTIDLNGSQLELSDTTGTETITGPKAGVTVNGGGLSGVFAIDPGVKASISGLTITGGSTGAAAAGWITPLARSR